MTDDTKQTPEIIEGYHVIKRAFVRDLIFKLGHNPDAVQPYVTWRCNKDDPTNNYWGHYWSDKSTAETDFFRRWDAARTDTPYDHTLLTRAEEISHSDTPMPDRTITTLDRNRYGYQYDGILPLNADRAVELFNSGSTIYWLAMDNAEGEVADVADILNHAEHGGIFGIEREAWHKEWKQKASERLHGLVDKISEGNLYYKDVEAAANELNLQLAEYGNQTPQNHHGAESYAFWNVSGNRHCYDKGIVHANYNFKDGAADKVKSIIINLDIEGLRFVEEHTPGKPSLRETLAANAQKSKALFGDKPQIPVKSAELEM